MSSVKKKDVSGTINNASIKSVHRIVCVCVCVCVCVPRCDACDTIAEYIYNIYIYKVNGYLSPAS